MWQKHPINRWIETCIAICFYYSGLVSLARWWRQQFRPCLLILNYHRADGGSLRQHLLYLRRHYRILHLEEALEELYTLSKEGKQINDRRTPMVVTFDDGYYDNYTYGFDLARELDIPITIFLIPGYMECGRSFWWMDRLIRHAKVDEVTIEGCTYHLNQQAGRKALAQAIDAHVSYAASETEREEFLIAIRKALSVPASLSVQENPMHLVGWEQVREMEANGSVSFGAHTMHHPILGNLTDPLEVQCEVRESRTVLEQQLGHPIRTFAYPYGQLDQVGESGLRAVQEVGYDWAVTTMYGNNTPQTPRHLLRRISVDISEHWLLLAARVSGVWHFFSCLAKIPITVPLKFLAIKGRGKDTDHTYFEPGKL